MIAPSRAVKALVLGCLVVGSVCLAQAAARADDWPQWRGPNRDGISAEKGWLSEWPEGGPKLLWKTKVGRGYSSVAVVGDHLYAMGRFWNTDAKGQSIKGANGRPTGTQVVWCLDASTGKVVWKHSAACSNFGPNDGGAHSTPTVYDGLLYAHGMAGDLTCLNAATGELVWTRDLVQDYGGQINIYGAYSCSPLVVQDRLVAECGTEQALIIALDRKTGREIWKYGKGTETGGASSPVAYSAGNGVGIIQLTKHAVVGLDAADGKQLWRYPWTATAFMTPVVHRDRLYLAGTGTRTGLVLELKQEPPNVVWQSKEMTNCFQTSVLLDGHLYGTHALGGEPERACLRCVSFDTGEVKWEHKEKGFGHASLIAADGKLIVFGQQGQLMVVEASPKRFKKLASAKVADHTCYNCECYACPVLSGGRIYCRNGGGEVVCLDVRRP